MCLNDIWSMTFRIDRLSEEIWLSSTYIVYYNMNQLIFLPDVNCIMHQNLFDLTHFCREMFDVTSNQNWCQNKNWTLNHCCTFKILINRCTTLIRDQQSTFNSIIFNENTEKKTIFTSYCTCSINWNFTSS